MIKKLSIFRRLGLGPTTIIAVGPGPNLRYLWAGCWFALICVFVGVNLAYLQEYRFGGILNIDEAGYIRAAMMYATALKMEGVLHWVRALLTPVAFAPLLPAFTSLLLVLLGASESVALCANTVMTVCLLGMSYQLARLMAGRSIGVLAVLLVVAMSEMQSYSTSFMFAIPTTLFFVCAVYTYIRSENFLNGTWSLLLGVSLALMILSRTMAVAFLPVFALVGGFYFFYDRLQWGRKWAHLGLAVLAFLLVAVPWYSQNYHAVFGYLTSYGYGAHAAEYDHYGTFFSWGGIKLRVLGVLQHLGVVYSYLVGAGLVSYVVSLYGLRHKIDAPRSRYLGICWSIALLCESIVFTTRNVGSAFDLPMLAMFVIVSVCSVFTLVQVDYIRRCLWVLIGSTCVGLYAIQQPWIVLQLKKVAPSYMLQEMLSDTYMGYIADTYVSYINASSLLTSRNSLFELTHQWHDFNEKAASVIRRHNPDKQLMTYVSRHYFLNLNTFSLEMLKRPVVSWREAWPVFQIDPIMLEHSVGGYKKWLRSPELAHNCFVLALSSNEGEFSPFVDVALFRQALISTGYQVIDTLKTPTPGQFLYIWRKKGCHRTEQS